VNGKNDAPSSYFQGLEDEPLLVTLDKGRKKNQKLKKTFINFMH
jgi:hypothetical protein